MSLIDNISIGQRVGGGAFGEIYINQDNNENVYKIAKHEYIDIIKEIAISSVLDNDNIINIIHWGFCVKDNLISIYYEMPLEMGNLLDFIIKPIFRDRRTPENLFDIAIQILRGVGYINANNFIHQDLKPQNILFNIIQDGTIEIKISDLGMAKHVSCTGTQSWKEIVTRGYKAPEIYPSNENDTGYTEYAPTIDNWSCGCIIYFIYMRVQPFGIDGEIPIEYYTDPGIIFNEMYIKKMVSGFYSENIEQWQDYIANKLLYTIPYNVKTCIQILLNMSPDRRGNMLTLADKLAAHTDFDERDKLSNNIEKCNAYYSNLCQNYPFLELSDQLVAKLKRENACLNLFTLILDNDNVNKETLQIYLVALYYLIYILNRAQNPPMDQLYNFCTKLSMSIIYDDPFHVSLDLNVRVWLELLMPVIYDLNVINIWSNYDQLLMVAFLTSDIELFLNKTCKQVKSDPIQVNDTIIGNTFLKWSSNNLRPAQIIVKDQLLKFYSDYFTTNKIITDPTIISNIIAYIQPAQVLRQSTQLPQPAQVSRQFTQLPQPQPRISTSFNPYPPRQQLNTDSILMAYITLDGEYQVALDNYNGGKYNVLAITFNRLKKSFAELQEQYNIWDKNQQITDSLGPEMVKKLLDDTSELITNISTGLEPEKTVKKSVKRDTVEYNNPIAREVIKKKK